MAISLDHRVSMANERALRNLSRSLSPPKNRYLKTARSKIKPTEVLFFTSQLSLMLEIGTPLKIALETIRDQTQNPAFKKVINSLVHDIKEGRQLSEILKNFPKVFNTVYVSMVKAGETGGFLTEILDRLVDIQEKREALKTQLRGALTYPAVLCVVAFLVVVFVLVYVLPKFTGFFAGKESILPITTLMLMSLSASLRDYWWTYILGFSGTLVAFKMFKQSELGKSLFDKVAVSGPLVKRLSNKINTCRLLRTLGSMLESRVPMVESLEVTRATIPNRYHQDFIDKIIGHVQGGGKFSQPFAAYPYTMDSVKKMVATGEEAGNLPKVMLRLADYYDTEVERELKHVGSLIEPLALIFMGVVVLFIVSSIILPLFRLAGALH